LALALEPPHQAVHLLEEGLSQLLLALLAQFEGCTLAGRYLLFKVRSRANAGPFGFWRVLLSFGEGGRTLARASRVKFFILQELIGVLLLEIWHELVLISFCFCSFFLDVRLQLHLREVGGVLLHVAILEDFSDGGSLEGVFAQEQFNELGEVLRVLRGNMFDGIVGDFVSQ
jgi:hypothetical protein